TTTFFAEFLGGREAGAEDKINHIAIIEHLIWADHATSNSLVAHTIWINTGTIVTHGNNYLVPLISCGQFNLTCRWLTLLHPHFRCLNSMVHCVTHEMQQWSGNFFVDRAIDFCVFPFQKEFKFLML